MYDDDDTTFSLASITDATSITTPTEDYNHHNEPEDIDLLDAGDEDYASGRWDLASGQSTSVPPSVYEDEVAHGRRYHGFRRGIYPLPNDEGERHREETVHAMFLQLMGGHLFYSNVGDFPQKIIDIGTGTGVWAIDVADQYPSASVIGTDLSPIQPSWVPINVRMFIEDCEEPEWLHGSDFDLIHFRQMAGVLRNLDALLTKIYPLVTLSKPQKKLLVIRGLTQLDRHVKNGGWIEFHEVIPEIHCDDGTMKEDDPLKRFTEVSKSAMRLYGFRHLSVGDIEVILERAGFTNIHCITKKVPVSTWPRDKYLRTLGVFMKATVYESLGAMAAKPLAALNMTEVERLAMVEAAKKSLEDNTIHRYINCCFCYAQKREGEVTTPFYGQTTNY